MRSRKWSVTSTGETSRAPIISRMRQAGAQVRSPPLGALVRGKWVSNTGRRSVTSSMPPSIPLKAHAPWPREARARQSCNRRQRTDTLGRADDRLLVDAIELLGVSAGHLLAVAGGQQVQEAVERLDIGRRVIEVGEVRRPHEVV